MPYYLVTHTSLVEGKDEAEAAEKVAEKLKSDTEVEFTVKSDGDNVRRVKVASPSTAKLTLPAADDRQQTFEVSEEPSCGELRVDDEPETAGSTAAPLKTSGTIFGVGLFAAGISIGIITDVLI